MTGRQPGGNALHAPDHLVGGAPGKGKKQDPARIGAMGQQVGHPVSKGGRFAGSGTGNYQKGAFIRSCAGADAMHGCCALGLVEGVEVVG